MKREILIFIIIASVFSGPPCYDNSLFPNPKGPVNDFAQKLSKEDTRILDSISHALLKEELVAAVFVTLKHVPKLDSIYNGDFHLYATDLFNCWGIGTKGKDEGLLFIVSKGDRKWSISTGYLTEHLLPDTSCDRIGREIVIPNLKAGNYGKAFRDAIIKAVPIMREKKRYMYPELYKEP
jgi:uncharacterized protein